MVMGVGASTSREKSGEITPLLNPSGGESRASREQVSFGDGVEPLAPHSNFFEPPDLQIPRMSIREDGVLVSGLPEDLDPRDRVRYERALFRLFFQRDLFVGGKDGRPPTFGTAVAPKDPLLHKVAEEAIDFADHLMRYVVETCGIEPKRFLDAAVSYTECCDERRRAGSTLGFLEHCLSTQDPATTGEQKHAQVSARSIIERACTELEVTVKEMSPGPFIKDALSYCRADLSVITDSMAACPSRTDTAGKVKLQSIHFAVACFGLRRHQATLSQSDDPNNLLLAAKAAATLDAVRRRLGRKDQELIKPKEVPVEPLLPALHTVAKAGDLQDVCNCAEVLECLLPLDGRAVDVLAALKSRYAGSGEVNRLIEVLGAIWNPPLKVIEFLRF